MPIRALFLVLAGAVATLVSALVNAPSPGPPLRPAATIVELMRAHVDPSASALFSSVATTTNAQGVHEHAPATEEAWSGLRTQALLLAESANLLMIAHRRVGAQPPFEEMVWRDRETWNRLVGYLAEAAGWTLEAIDQRNVIRLQSHTGDIALACELCHLHYRYPGASRRLDLPER